LVASCVGGVGEIITDDTGYPVRDIDSIQSYIQAIEAVFQTPATAEQRAMKAKQYVEKMHTRNLFYQSIAELPGYLHPTQAMEKDL